jgi:Glycosyl hydrolase family 36 N-terminal domain
MSKRWLLSLLLVLFIVPLAKADIQYFPDRKVWVLQAGETTYAMGVNERGELQAIYWGQQVKRGADFSPPQVAPEVASFDLSNTTTPQEYPGWGSEHYNEPALKATFANGNRDVVLHYADQHIDGDTLEITLKDVSSPLEAHLYYRIFPDTGIVARWSRIVNKTDQAVVLESAQSATWSLPHGVGYGPGIGARSGSFTPNHSRPASTSLKAGAAAPLTSPIPGSPSTVRARPQKKVVPFGSAPWAGVEAGASPWSRPRWSRCALPAASTPSTSAIN